MFLFTLILHKKFTLCKSGLNRTSPIYEQPSPKRAKRVAKDTNKQPIRILFETDLLNSATFDPRRCDAVGQEIQLKTGPYSCTSSDILTAVERDFLYSVIDEVKTTLESSFKVTPYQGAIEKKEWTNEVELPTCDSSNPNCNAISGYDLIITVAAHPSMEQYVSESYIATVNQDDHRPLHGYLISNPCYISTTTMDLAYKHVYANILLHEVVHLLGFHKDLFQYFHPQNSNEPFSQITCDIKKNGKTMRFLVTPYSHIFATKHFGLQEFVGDDGTKCPSGIELEDFENDYNHPKGRVYFSEQITSYVSTITKTFARFSDVTMALLLDTGNYEIDHKIFQPNMWLNGDALDGRTHSSFALGDYSDFPSEYVADPFSSFPQNCGFTYKFYGTPATTNAYNCSQTAEENGVTEDELEYYCKSQEYYNPRQESVIGSLGTYDYAPIILIDEACSDNQAALPGFSLCMSYNITDSEVVFTTASDMQFPDGIKFTCSSANEGQTFTYRSYTNDNGDLTIKKHTFRCPNQERFRRSMQLFDSYFAADPFTGDGFSYTQRYQPEKQGQSNDPNPIDPNLPRRTPSPSFVPPTRIDPNFEETVKNQKDNNYLGMGLSKSVFLSIVCVCVVFIVIIILLILCVKCYIMPHLDDDSSKTEADISEDTLQDEYQEFHNRDSESLDSEAKKKKR